MKYKGIELKEVTESQLFHPPKYMLVWDNSNELPAAANVCAIVNRDKYRVIAEATTWEHCAEFPEVAESKLVTNRELARWLSEGNGQVMWLKTVCSNWNYSNDDANEALDKSLYVRKWDDTEWHKLTREYLGLED